MPLHAWRFTAPYVEDTTINWEIEVPTVDEMAARIAGLRASHEWLVLERDDEIVGFAYAQPLVAAGCTAVVGWDRDLC